MAVPIRPIPVIADNIPAELKARAQWVLWALETRAGKQTKVPYDARRGTKASCDDPDTWAGFGTALDAYDKSQASGGRFSGIGYQFAADDPYFGVDLDKCIDPVTGAIEPWALDIVRRLDSYTERSPSGTGLRIICRGKLPPGSRRKGQIEMYEEDRYLTITGQRLDGTPDDIRERSAELRRVCKACGVTLEEFARSLDEQLGD